ncbi:retrotransposon protein, putative, ty1-copia subclass, partial [Tanacetum coccineum]
MYVIEQPILPAPAADSIANVLAEWNAVYDYYNEVACLMSEYEKGLPERAETPQGTWHLDVSTLIRMTPATTAREVGHWKRNCPVYLAELLKKKKQVGTASSSGARKPEQGALYLYVGNGFRAQVEAIGSFDLVLPNGLVICLDNCHYAPTITRGVVSVHCLVENEFVQCFTDYGILVFKNDILYFNDIPRNGIYKIDMHNLVPNVNSIYNVSNKRAKHNLNSTYLWRCHFAHIRSTDDESFDQCMSCLSCKMTRKPFSHRTERATDLLGIIHIDVCGPLRHVSRQGASYFITFMDDYSRYGYTIKALRSDRGGEYINQEFKDYLKACGIFQQLTPSYTPQHNGVSERRNEFATRILNMVPTKKVDKTPYELWYGKVTNLSYLKVWRCEALVKRDTLDKLQQRSVKYVELFEKSLITQEVSRRAIDLEEIQDEDTSPSEITSEIPMEVKDFKPPQEEVILIHNMVWVLVDLPPNCKTVGSKWNFKKNADKDGIVHTYKARLVTKGYTQLYGVYYEETFSPVADIRAIRILISITAFYDYEIWQMDVKTAFLNSYLDE